MSPTEAQPDGIAINPASLQLFPDPTPQPATHPQLSPGPGMPEFDLAADKSDFEATIDQTPDLGSASTSRAPSRGPLPSLSAPNPDSASASHTPSPYPQLAIAPSRRVLGTRTVFPPTSQLAEPFASYVPFVDDLDEDEGFKAVRRKGKSRLRQADNLAEEEEEWDDRLYCVCLTHYNAHVSDLQWRIGIAGTGADSGLVAQRAMIACDMCALLSRSFLSHGHSADTFNPSAAARTGTTSTASRLTRSSPSSWISSSARSAQRVSLPRHSSLKSYPLT